MAVTRINNNQITDASAGNVYVGINASTKLQDYSITAGKIANSLVYGSDLTVSGNLTVNGQTTTIDTISTVIEDPVIVLASNQSGSPSVDIGFIGERGTSDNIAFVWDESADEFVTAFTTDLVTNTTVTISSYANFHTNDANVGGNITINGTTTLVGNITSALNVTGNITGGNLLTEGVVTATGNITGGNINTGGQVVATGNVTGTGVVMTGNITGGNLLTSGQVVATANITGGNLVTSGLTSTGTLAVSSTSSFTGNITSAFNVTGNIAGGNISTPGLIDAVGNITGGNLTATSNIYGAHLQTTGNALIGGNLIVQGNITYINIDDLRVEDPIIVLGTGPNGAPLTTDDGKDRGIYMEWYTTGLGNSWIGWQNTTGNLIAAADVVFASNDVVQVNSYGTFQAGNIYIESALSTGNITGTGVVMSGNITGGNLLTAGLVNATGNVTGGNINTGGQVVATGNVTGGNLITAGLASVTGNITGGNVSTTNLSLAGNVLTALNVTGNITGPNVIGTTSVTGGNIVITGDDITDTNGRVNFNTAGGDVDFAVNGDTVANVFYVDAGTGTASFGSSTQTTGAILALNSATSVLMPVGNTAQRPTGTVGMLRFNSTDDNLEIYSTAGWEAVGVPTFTVIADEQFNGDGSTVAFVLSSEQTTSSCIVSINGVVQIPTVAYSVSGTGTSTLTFTEAPEPGDLIDVREITTTTSVTSISNTSGNAAISANPTLAQMNITGDLVPVANVTYDLGNATNRWNELFLAGSTLTLGNVVMKNVAGGNTVGFYGPDGTTPATIASTSVDTTTIANGTSNVQVVSSAGNIRFTVGGTRIIGVTSSGIYNDQANGVGNIGSTDSYFNTVFAKATSAQYADLAEKYTADAEYAPGTVVVFGGDKEVTVSSTDADRAVAGVVSTNPSYIMNSGLESTFVATVALTGRVPTRVTGTVKKGDLMVSAGYGLARAEADPKVGTVIGKALENHEGNEGVIEVVVGRF